MIVKGPTAIRHYFTNNHISYFSMQKYKDLFIHLFLFIYLNSHCSIIIMLTTTGKIGIIDIQSLWRAKIKLLLKLNRIHEFPHRAKWIDDKDFFSFHSNKLKSIIDLMSTSSFSAIFILPEEAVLWKLQGNVIQSLLYSYCKCHRCVNFAKIGIILFLWIPKGA